MRRGKAYFPYRTGAPRNEINTYISVLRMVAEKEISCAKNDCRFLHAVFFFCENDKKMYTNSWDNGR